jgi:hypothetical protein
VLETSLSWLTDNSGSLRSCRPFSEVMYVQR